MGHLLTNYQGAVVFIDLLGFGALTNGRIPLTEQDISAWIKDNRHPKNHHFLAANLLVELRRILQDLEPEYLELKISQLSDCFFGWSDNVIQVIEFTQAFMHRAIRSGLLCRGGLAYGQIIETNNNHRHGRLILGDAVTKAVGLEKPAKGARILTEVELVKEALDTKGGQRFQEYFVPFENPLDFQVYDEFRWYLTEDFTNVQQYGPSHCSADLRLQFSKRRLELDTLLIYSPKFGWNARTAEGMVHLKATSNFLSKSGLLKITHDFERRGFPDVARVSNRVGTINSLVEQDEGWIATT